MLSLNADALRDLQQKSCERLIHHKKTAAFEIIEDIVFASYQLELIGAHMLPNGDHAAFMRHQGRVDSLWELVKLFNHLKDAEIKKAVENEKKNVRRSFETSRAII